MVSRGLTHQGFGAFAGEIWNLVSRTHDSILGDIQRTHAHLIIVTHATDLVITRERRINLVLYDNVGVKHKGRPTLPEFVDTVLVIWAKQNIPMITDTKRGIGPSRTDRFMFVAKDRGKPFSFQVRYDDNLWDSLKSARRDRSMMPINIKSDKEHAELVEKGLIAAESDERPGVAVEDKPKMPGIDGIDGTEGVAGIEGVEGSQ